MLWEGGGVGTLLQNLCKMLFRQKYFYLLKIFGGGARAPPGPMGTTPLGHRRASVSCCTRRYLRHLSRRSLYAVYTECVKTKLEDAQSVPSEL